MFVGKYSNGQNNLQFNKIVLVEADTTYFCNSSCDDYILQRVLNVPLGKALKIESVNVGRNDLLTTDFYLNSVKIGSVGIYDKPVTLPIWLPSGTYLLKLRIKINSGTIDFSYQISGIELNLI